MNQERQKMTQKFDEIRDFLSNLRGEVSSLEQSYFQVLTVLKGLEKRLENTADRDDLTGLLRRKPFFRKWDALLTRCAELDQSCSMLVIDIDHFKNINDTYGHPVGDEVLRRIGQLLSKFSTENPNILACRFGGEEFVLACGGSEAQALDLGECLRTVIANDPSNPVCTVSIGIASGLPSRKEREYSEFSDQILKAADHALYRAKRAGRNRVCQASLSLLQNTG